MSLLVLVMALCVAWGPAPASADDRADLLASIQKGVKLTGEGKYVESAAELERALEFAPRVVAKDGPEVGFILFTLANAQQAIGQFDKSELALRRALPIFEAKFGKDHPMTGSVMGSLGFNAMHRGDYAKAEPLLVQALKIKETKLGENHFETAHALGALGGIYSKMGQFGKAETLLLRSVAAYESANGKNTPTAAESLNQLGLLYTEMQKFDKALPVLERALALREASVGKDHPETAVVLNNLATVHQFAGKFDKAEQLWERCLEILEARFGKDTPNTVATINNLGFLSESTGKFEKARELYRRALTIQEKHLGRNNPELNRPRMNLARIHAVLRDWDQAANFRDADRRALRAFIASTLPILSDDDQGRFLYFTDRFSYFEALSHGFVRRLNAKERNLSAGWVLNGKSVAQQAQAEKALLARESANPQTAPLSKQLVEVRQRLAGLTLRQDAKIPEATRQKQIDQLATLGQDLVAQLGRLIVRGSTAGSWVELADVRAAIPADSVLVEIALFELRNIQANPLRKDRASGPHYAAWIIPAAGAGEVAIVDLGPADKLDAAIKAVRKELEAAAKTIAAKGEPEAEKALKLPLAALSKLILQPLLPHIGSAKNWIVSPDGNLWIVPWAALPLEDGKYAVEKFNIHYVTTGRDLLATKNRKVTATAPMILADPDFNLGQTEAEAEMREVLRKEFDDHRGLSRDFKLGNVRRLEGTAIEAEAIIPHLKTYTGKEPKVLTGKQALTGIFKAAQNPRVVFLGTHGYFLEDEAPSGKGTPFVNPANPVGRVAENPLLRCGLLLAGCNRASTTKAGADNGVLTGLEIVGTDLRGTELVVLSACETGLGDVKVGEGVAGLRQAFQLAGAESVVATLWQVPDLQSAQLMVGFFDNLAKGQDRDDALSHSQTEVIAKRRAKNGSAHPFYWAAYTLTGSAK